MTRKGYEDPYALFNIATPATTPPPTTEVDIQQIVEPAPVFDRVIDNGAALGVGPAVMMIPPVDPSLQLAGTTCIPESDAALSQELSGSEQNAMALTLPPSPKMTQAHDNSSIYMDNASMMTDFDLSGSDRSFGLDADPISLHLASMGNLDIFSNVQSGFQPMQGVPWPRYYLKPWESKANERLRI